MKICLPYHTQVREQHLSIPRTTPTATHGNVINLSGESTSLLAVHTLVLVVHTSLLAVHASLLHH